jgi:ADP-ribosylglycohydrolase
MISTPDDQRRGDALEGALLGLAVGDALGFVVEAQPPDVAREYVTAWLRQGRVGERSPAGFPFGQYSDDTQLARELLLSVLAAGDWEPDRFGLRVATLICEGKDVGAGPGTRSAGMRLALGAPWTMAGTPAPYAGNGSAMRAGPVGVLFPGRPERWRRCAREQSRMTHHDPRCTAGAVAIAGAAALAAEPGPVLSSAFLAQLSAWVEEEDHSLGAAIASLEGWLTLDPTAAARHVHESGLESLYAGRWQGISAHVVPSVLWSLYAFLRSPDEYWESVCTAIAVGGDTDTLAAMTGSIAGARLGPSALPAAVVDRLNDRGQWDAPALRRLARACAAIG